MLVDIHSKRTMNTNVLFQLRHLIISSADFVSIQRTMKAFISAVLVESAVLVARQKCCHQL